ncbi:MAG: hypothetical protein ABFS03_01335 [Chloroflexota bacterium]
MFKKILITTLSTVIVGAAGTSAYNAVVTQKAETGRENIPAVSLEVTAPETAAEKTLEGTSPTDASGLGSENQFFGGQNDALNDGQGYQGTGNQGNGNQGIDSQGNGNQDIDSQGNGNRGNGKGGNGNRGANRGGGENADPQNGLVEWVTFHGTVSDYAAPYFTLTNDDGQTLPAQLGDLGFVEGLGLYLEDGDVVSLTGYWDASGGFAVGIITLDETGQSFTLRDELGRPLWSGGRTN